MCQRRGGCVLPVATMLLTISQFLLEHTRIINNKITLMTTRHTTFVTALLEQVKQQFYTIWNSLETSPPKSFCLAICESSAQQLFVKLGFTFTDNCCSYEIPAEPECDSLEKLFPAQLYTEYIAPTSLAEWEKVFITA